MFKNISFLQLRFVAQEADAMRFKLQMASPQEITHFMNTNELRYTNVNEEEKTRLAAQLAAAAGANNPV